MKICCDQLTGCLQQCRDVGWCYRMRVGLAQQGDHRSSFIKEEPDVALWFSKGQGTAQHGHGPCVVSLRLQHQRTQQENFKHTTHAHFCFSILKEPLQQHQCLREE